MRNHALHLFLLGLISLDANAADAGSEFQLTVQNPFPVCITELHKIEPDIPLSFFQGEVATHRPYVGASLPDNCVRELNLELTENGIKEGVAYFINTFPQVDRKIFADSFMRKKDHEAELKRLNQTLMNCQARTEAYHKLAALASKDIYDESRTLDSVPPGYEIVDKRRDFFLFPQTQVQAYVIRPKVPNSAHLPPIIAFRGTASKRAWFSDTSLGSNQLKNVINKFELWINDLRSERYKEVIVTGHSLGGGLAQAAVGAIKGFPLTVNLVTFNGFGGVQATETYGIQNHISSSLTQIKNRDAESFQATRDAVAYRMQHDVVSTIGEQFGQTRTLPSPYGKFNVLGNHDIHTVLATIQKNPHILASIAPRAVALPITKDNVVPKFQAFFQRSLDEIGNSEFDLTNTLCRKPFNPNSIKIPNTCTHLGGDPAACVTKGKLEISMQNYNAALDKFKTGCDLCQADSCLHYAALNKLIGEEYKADWAADKGCNLDSGLDSAEFFKCIRRFDDLGRTGTVREKNYGYDPGP